MIGKKEGMEDVFHYFRMHELVPDDHILKMIDRHIDFSFVRERMRPLYSHTGRPSVDPEVMVRMLLVGYLFGIKSERRLCEEVGMHVGYRWFVGLNMADKVPDHSTFSKNRHGRLANTGIYEEIFDEIVRRCMRAGLVKAKHVTADGTLVAADASLSSMEPIVVEMQPKEYLDEMDKTAQPEEKKEDNDKDDPDGARASEFKNKGAKITNKTHRSKTDPDSRIARKSRYGDTKLSYQVALIMDNASRVILDASVSGKAGRGEEMRLALAGLDRMKWHFGLKPETIGADKGYAVGAFVRDVFQRGTTPHVPLWDTRREHDRGIYTIESFTYNKDNNTFTCPQGNTLKHHGKNHKQTIWRASTKDCGPCPVKTQCTRDTARSVSRHIHQEHIDKAREEMKTKGYILSQRNRKKIEELFGENKEQMGMRRMKFRGKQNAAEQVLLTATAQNIKRLVKYLSRNTPEPAGALRKTLENLKIPLLTSFIEGIFAFFEKIYGISFKTVAFRQLFVLP